MTNPMTEKVSLTRVFVEELDANDDDDGGDADDDGDDDAETNAVRIYTVFIRDPHWMRVLTERPWNILTLFETLILT